MARSCWHGGSLSLAELFDEYGEYIESDFLRFYGIDIYDLWDETSRLTPERANRLIRNLPDESLTKAMLAGGPEYLGWDRTTSVLADVFDAVQSNTYAVVMGNADSKSKKKIEEPQPYPRPGQDSSRSKAKKNKNSFAAMAYSKLQGD